MNSNPTQYDKRYIPGFKKERINAWPEGMHFEDNQVEASAERHYQRFPIPDQTQRSLHGNAQTRCLEGPGHSSLNSW